MCLATRQGASAFVGTTRADPAVGKVLHLVERRHVHAPRGARRSSRARRSSPQSAPPTPPGSPKPGFSALNADDDLADREHGLLAVAEHHDVDEIGHRLGVEGRVPAHDHERVQVAALGGHQRDPGQVEAGEHVGVAQLGGERDPDEVERAEWAVAVDRERRDVALTHQPLEVGPHRVAALGEHAGGLVEHLVEDLHALVGQAHLVGVGVHQRPPHAVGVPVLGRGVELTADVLHGLADQG